ILEALERAREILERDLIPRGACASFVVGLVGPNNAGKSALFNALAGRICSPSMARGGATRRLLAATRDPSLGLRGFDSVLPVEPGPTGVEAASEPGRAGELLATSAPELPPGLWLVDAPDFDSILEDHRGTAESLLSITDLAVVVVTRHSYQNLEVVEFLKRWLGSGRPWVLVYNEAPSPELALEHCEVLIRAVGSRPRALFQAPQDLAVAEGTRPLMPVSVGDATPNKQTLAGWLGELGNRRELQRAAWLASRAQLVQALESYSELRERDGALRHRLRLVATEQSDELARAVCMDAMPMGPVLEAFRNVLDRRPHPIRAGLRKGLRGARSGLLKLWSKVGGELSPVQGPAPTNLLQAERSALEPRWAPFVEQLESRMLASCPASAKDWVANLRSDLAPEQLATGRTTAFESLGNDPEVWQAFELACEGFIEEDLDQRGNEWSLQAMVDLCHLVPAAVAGAIIVKSGGLLTDMAVGSMGAVSAMAMEKLSRFLGTGTANRARRKWSQLRGERMSETILRSALPKTWSMLQAQPKGDAREWTRWLTPHPKESRTPDHA
ncbi:MAG: 50S ribosome-binding GTPase, partial [Planctomycetes bacterium]|nr:50S ribosome-binding GTPase [Planctomycetota bacterium]